MRGKPTYEELERRILELVRAADVRMQSEEALHENKERYLLHFSLTNDVIYSLDSQFRVKTVSPNVERVLGYKPEELVDRSFPELNVLHPDSMDLAVSDALRVLSGEKIYSSVYRFITKAGTIKFGEVSGVPFVRNGTPVEVISVARDITERIEMEKSLRESEERFRTIFESAQDCIFIKNLDLEYAFVNPCMEKVFGLGSEEILALGDQDLFGEGSDPHGREIDMRVIGGEVVEEEYSKVINGDFLTFHIIKVPLRDSTGKVNGMCGIARDITDRKHYEEELMTKERELAHQATYLEEMNIALKVLLDSREKEKKQAQEAIAAKVRKILYPYIEKLGEEILENRQSIYLDIIKENLDELLVPYHNSLSNLFINSLTPMEMRIADLIRHGKSTKEIASLLNVSPHAVSFHRGNIRKKCGLLNTKKNLRAYLHGADPGRRT
jgi:PAS domain S-box-containing protein